MNTPTVAFAAACLLICLCFHPLQVEGTLVAAGTLGLLRLCQRLLPCKPEAAELLLRGLQLVPSVDPEVCVLFCVLLLCYFACYITHRLCFSWWLLCQRLLACRKLDCVGKVCFKSF